MITVQAWADRYERLVEQRVIMSVITAKTMSDYTRMIKRVRQLWSEKLISEITVADIARDIESMAIKAPHSARRFRLNLSDFFREAQRDGLVPIGYDPASITREPFTPIATNRLTFSEWSAIFCKAESVAPQYFTIAMLLALVTAQRRGDIVTFHSSHVFDEHLHIRQQKTGEMIALPLNLRLNALDITLADVIAMCPPSGLLLRHKNGKPVNPWSLSYWFKRCRDETIAQPKVGKPPSFREQRSLSERLYRAEGIDTKTLLGHRYQSMTDQYNSLRGRDYRRLIL
ncbi:tyrosine-type recombinase/integrase [Serratia fonticola]|uniref:Tyrosine-type recombinase/integrase n=1 Tax=Serratia fonticola TaxID=47917 RepID=A0AAW3WYU4_SERFO|nr:tyrosine-type recombinase/integrase [Serratia fonticola]MBC3214787.1 tyrosine-type recombinase/integrase [Serratia fonticola]NYA15820.1 tyrosine-type recombinase/integrase [Serratia fonticola]NYA35708.1 tyrosine-type recombinase/integrase [Serratia fonticola]